MSWRSSVKRSCDAAQATGSAKRFWPTAMPQYLRFSRLRASTIPPSVITAQALRKSSGRSSRSQRTPRSLPDSSPAVATSSTERRGRGWAAFSSRRGGSGGAGVAGGGGQRRGGRVRAGVGFFFQVKGAAADDVGRVDDARERRVLPTA